MGKFKTDSIWHAVKQNFITDAVFWENEVAANRFTAKAMLLQAALLLLSWILNRLGIFATNSAVMTRVASRGILELVIPAAICLYFNGEKKWLKYLLMLEMTVVQARIDSVLTYNVELAMVLPVVLSCRYYSHGFTKQIAVLSTILFAIAAFCGAWFDMGEYMPMYAAETKALYTRNIMTQYFFPKWLIFMLVSVVCIKISRWGRHMVLEQASISQEHSRVETELEMARRIQNRALPIVHSLPAQSRPAFDLAASMEPAKEVGGDFYDFFYLDDTHLVLMIADVSGKGVPAALFMMASKLLLDNSISTGRSPGKVLEDVNHQLCEKNLENMFVTVWLGILDLETGELVSANAGHEYPLICRKGGSFEVIKDKHGFVLGGMSGMHYKETTMHLDPGDILFVYTDGVPEANDPDEAQFGMERTLKSLNANKDKTMEEITANLKADISAFSRQAPQFDDTTMLALRMIEYKKKNEICTKAEPDSISRVADFVSEIMEAAEVPMKFANRINIAVDEVYSNIVNHSGATRASVACTADGGTVTLTFRDNGMAYDPTMAEAPDITASAEDRDLGGLGIFMTKKLTDSMEYSNENGLNCLTVKVNY